MHTYYVYAIGGMLCLTVGTPALFLEDHRFEYQSVRLRFSVVFLSPSLQNLLKYFKLGHNCFTSHWLNYHLVKIFQPHEATVEL